MSLRPRFAAEGRLRLPDEVHVVSRAEDPAREGNVVGHFGQRDRDPFERTADDVLLAESFARADLRDPVTATAWFSDHGVLDLEHFFPEPMHPAYKAGLDAERFRDWSMDVSPQQSNVRWHLESLARLSYSRAEALQPRPGWAAHQGWDPAWSQPVVENFMGDALWLGGASHHEARIPSPMKSYPSFRAYRPKGAPGRIKPEGMTDREFRDVWWPTANRTWRRIKGTVPVIWVPEEDWHERWSRYDPEAESDGRDPSGRLSADWHGLLELERRLLEPYVVRAAERIVGIRRGATWGPPTASGAIRPYWERRLFVHEERRWTSLLAPVYLQLLEALLRISEGNSGAAHCKECGLPFLTLDARRSSFCNDRERFRYAQRLRRRRLADTEGEA